VCGWAARADAAAGRYSARATATSAWRLAQATSHWKFACAWESRCTEDSPFLHLLYRFLTNPGPGQLAERLDQARKAEADAGLGSNRHGRASVSWATSGLASPQQARLVRTVSFLIHVDAQVLSTSGHPNSGIERLAFSKFT
jgi:hypothetical protein